MASPAAFGSQASQALSPARAAALLEAAQLQLVRAAKEHNAALVAAAARESALQSTQDELLRDGEIASAAHRGTRDELSRVWVLRKFMTDMSATEAMEFLKDRMKGTKDNEEFLLAMNG